MVDCSPALSESRASIQQRLILPRYVLVVQPLEQNDRNFLFRLHRNHEQLTPSAVLTRMTLTKVGVKPHTARPQPPLAWLWTRLVPRRGRRFVRLHFSKLYTANS